MPRTTQSSNGFIRANNITDEMIDGIIEQVGEGIPVHIACENLGTSATQFRFRYQRDSEIAGRLAVAHEDYKTSILTMVRAGIWEEAFVRKNYKALRDLALVYDPDWDKMRTQRYEHTVTNTNTLEEGLQRVFGGKSLHEIEAMIRYLESAPVEEHPVLELPVKSEVA